MRGSLSSALPGTGPRIFLATLFLAVGHNIPYNSSHRD